MITTFGKLMVIAGLSAALVLPAMAAGPDGLWRTGDGKATVRVAPCGGAICGHVVALRNPNGADGKPKLDVHNTNAALRKRKILGSAVLLGMKPNGHDSWHGAIYNAEDGKTYSAYFTLLSANRAKVQGCVAGIFCKSQIWSRQ
ncbi:MAG: DUF2147 domain-containing protein [Hyphomicrobiales bacterium]|nr:DUF2147 domain-containing protein [Hyphomicrobiales bacterium]